MQKKLICGRAVSGTAVRTALVITAYIAVYIQRLYPLYKDAGVRSTVAVLGLATNQGRRQPPQICLRLKTRVPGEAVSRKKTELKYLALLSWNKRIKLSRWEKYTKIDDRR